MKIKITTEIKSIIESLGNITRVKSGYKVYAALFGRSHRKNPEGYFDVPSTYLKSVNDNYKEIIDCLIAGGIITYKQSLKIDKNDVFKTVSSKTYSTDKGFCMKYKFLIDPSTGIEMEVDMSSGRKKRWYEITYNSLVALGYPPEITRDSFGRRVHYPLIQDYKTELQNKGLCAIDACTSHPRLLWILMKENDIIDPDYHQIFAYELDLYTELANKFNLKDREAGRDLFSQWVNGKKHLPLTNIRTLYPIANNYISGLKKSNYKDSAAYLQRKEAAIWIDDLLTNIPTEFALPVHDSIIVKVEDFDKVLAYCKAKYPELRFKRKDI